eukprot:scaffold163725_cov27-Tisochrysis_lutea.AAC.1
MATVGRRREAAALAVGSDSSEGSDGVGVGAAARKADCGDGGPLDGPHCSRNFERNQCSENEPKFRKKNPEHQLVADSIYNSMTTSWNI